MFEPFRDCFQHPRLILPERVQILLERSMLPLEFQKLARVVDSRLDLLLIPDNTRINHQPFRILLRKLRNFRNRKACKSLLEIRPLVLDNLPVQTRSKYRPRHPLKILIIVLGRLNIPHRRHEVDLGGARYLWRLDFYPFPSKPFLPERPSQTVEHVPDKDSKHNHQSKRSFTEIQDNRGRRREQEPDEGC